MTIRRSNPWPALTDLFAALLVSTFAGLIIIDYVGQADASEQDTATLQARISTLSEALAEETSKTEALEAELAQISMELANLKASEAMLAQQKADLEEQLADLQRAGQERQERLSYFEKQVKNRGMDPPPCLLVNGRPQPLVEITVYNEGLMGIKRLALGDSSRIATQIPGYEKLETREPITTAELARIAGPIYAWGRSPENSFGAECVFYTVIVIETDSKDELTTTLSYVTDFFFILNRSEIRAFNRRGGS